MACDVSPVAMFGTLFALKLSSGSGSGSNSAFKDNPSPSSDWYLLSARPGNRSFKLGIGCKSARKLNMITDMQPIMRRRSLILAMDDLLPDSSQPSSLEASDLICALWSIIPEFSCVSHICRNLKAGGAVADIQQSHSQLSCYWIPKDVSAICNSYLFAPRDWYSLWNWETVCDQLWRFRFVLHQIFTRQRGPKNADLNLSIDKQLENCSNCDPSYYGCLLCVTKREPGADFCMIKCDTACNDH